MTTIRYEVDLYCVWVREQDPPAYAGYMPKSGNGYIYRVKNQPTNTRSIDGQRRTYTDGVLTASADFTLAPGASVTLPALVSLTSTDMVAMLAPEADAAYWCPSQWSANDGYSLTYRFVGIGNT